MTVMGKSGRALASTLAIVTLAALLDGCETASGGAPEDGDSGGGASDGGSTGGSTGGSAGGDAASGGAPGGGGTAAGGDVGDSGGLGGEGGASVCTELTLFDGTGTRVDGCNAAGIEGWFSLRQDSFAGGLPVSDALSHSALSPDSGSSSSGEPQFTADSEKPCISGTLPVVTNAAGNACTSAECEWDTQWGAAITLSLDQLTREDDLDSYDSIAADVAGFEFELSGDLGSAQLEFSAVHAGASGYDYCVLPVAVGEVVRVDLADLEYECWSTDAGSLLLDRRKLTEISWRLRADNVSTHTVTNLCIESVSAFLGAEPQGPARGIDCLEGPVEHSSGGTITGSASKNAHFDTTRNEQNYTFSANGWGPNWASHTLTYGGTTLSVDAYSGSEGPFGEPAGFPLIHCGSYSGVDSQACGLPALLDGLTEVDTGLRWSHAGSGTDYAILLDAWLGDGLDYASGLQIWLLDPTVVEPVGTVRANNVYVGDDPERWTVWSGTANSVPIVTFTRPVGEESSEVALDLLDFIDAATAYGLEGDTLLGVAAGAEIFNGPITDLAIEDFCVEPQ